MSEAKAKRKTVFIQKGFQARFIGWVIALIVLCCLCSAAFLYPLMTSEVSSKLTSGHMGADQAGEGLALALLMGILPAIIIAALMSAVVFLYISHKIAGPLYRFERVCEEIGRGNLKVSAKLREADQLKGLSDAFSDMLANLNTRQQERNASAAAAKDSVNELRGAVGDNAAAKNALDALDQSLAALTEDGDA